MHGGRYRLTGCLTGMLLWMCLGPFVAGARAQILLPDLQGTLLDPFTAPAGTKATVFLFTSTDCPISNRYQPEIRRLFEKFAVHEAAFWMVYPNPAETPTAIREHARDYANPVKALRDPQHVLVKLAGATITPEAAIFDAQNRLVYHGRIDDRYVDVGRQRSAPTTHDLEDGLAAVLAGRPVLHSTRPAVGCFIADFLP